MAATASPEPVSKTYGYYSAGCWISSGITAILAGVFMIIGGIYELK